MKNFEFLKIGVLYKKPLSIVALVLIVFLFLIKQFLSLSIFSNLSESSTFLIINKFLDYTFYISIGIAAIGFSVYYLLKFKNKDTKFNDSTSIQVGVGIVINEDKVLMVKRRKKEGNLLWQFPAGMIKPSDNGESATINEIKKETNIDCVIRENLGERIHPDTKIKCIYYHCEYVCGEVYNLDLDENADAKWVEINMVKKYITSDLFVGIENLFKSLKN